VVQSTQIGAVGGAAAMWPLAARAGKMPRLALVNLAVPIRQMTEDGAPFYRSFFAELKRLGFQEGGNIIIEVGRYRR
jgi:hypothetical protein